VWAVYFLINTCLTGLRSSGILSREVSVFIIIGLTARRGGEGRERGKRRWTLVESEYGRRVSPGGHCETAAR